MTWKRDELFSEGGQEAKVHWEAHLKDPWHWVHQAWMFKRAAEEIDTFSLVGRGFSNRTANERDRELQLIIPIYRFLLALLRLNLFSYRNLWDWLDDPFETPPELPDPQLRLAF